ncbi:hypothetical protein [Ruegeria arenilitoris]|uniref:hypothetical protein n=1 Tax=Ruegeria arenilitoris TaxID=1173585 RepID=UPI00147CA94F|nr:hypothetical protein [Ruegeria arenilitoris]
MAKMRLFLSVVASLCVFIVLLPFSLAGESTIIEAGVLIDDAFIYAVIAENIASGLGATFDGIHPTNGYQPLWMLLIVIAKTVAPSLEIISIQIWLSVVLYSAGSGLLVWWFVEKFSFPKLLGLGFLLSFSVLNPSFFRPIFLGLETPLLFSLIPIWLIYARQLVARKDNASHILALALTSCGIFLTRTDMFWVVPVAALVVLYLHRASFRTACFFLPCLSIVLAYLLYNLHYFGSLIPVSGRVKKFYMNLQYPTWESYWASDQWQGLFSMTDKVWNMSFYVTLLFLAITFIPLISRKYRAFLPKEFLIFSIITMLHLLYLQFIHREVRPYTSYYFLPETIFILVSVSFLFQRFAGIFFEKMGIIKAVNLRYSGAILATTAIAWAFLQPRYELKPSENWRDRLAVVRTASALLQPSDLVGAFWPGLIAYTMPQTVVPLDGIAASPQYFESVVKTGTELERAAELGINHLIVEIPDNFSILQPIDSVPRWSQIYLSRLSNSENFHFEEVHTEGNWKLLRMNRK